MADKTRSGFDSFMQKVENELEMMAGISSLDIPDYDYWNSYEDCVSPATTAKRALKEAMSF